MSSGQTPKYIDTHFKNNVDNNIKAFEQSVIKNYNFEKAYKLKSPMLWKHFIIKAIEEFNNILTAENKEVRVDFNEDTRKYFIRLDHDYFKKQGCISDKEEIFPLKLYQGKIRIKSRN